ncbi:uncharacterized protein KD926_007105 [Aspergillus affinis]|uniref:uncharacterized protein n=1 Tax=Aspergillus affinis TaxID=1070780 RepID=UPI0022FEEC8E|nr:uncharacterized protein KD926_007105 [Aspergillus affinis]KAI9045802.1 hypothetical protein KD926_007105 [Aspergillus affinis]
MRLLGATLASAALAVALPSASQTTSATSSSSSAATEPCAVVSRLLENSDTGDIAAEAAYKCLKSVPVAVKDDEELIDELKLLWQWHSETGWLKNPPSTWELGPLDLIGELDKIKKNLHSYDSEYDVQSAINRLTVRTGNYHFNYEPDILQVFSFQRLLGVATVSEDGTSVPKTYVSADLFARKDDDSIDISPIKSINGKDVQKFLEEVADDSQYINPDARYNSLADRGLQEESRGYFLVQQAYQGAYTNFTFANGTTRDVVNVAMTAQNFSDIASGKDFFQSFCTGDISSYGADSEMMKKSHLKRAPLRRWAKRQTIPSDDYPNPIVEHSLGAVAGYFLTGSGLTDVAVLKIITFDPKETGYREFQKVIRQFLERCTQANKKKLVIDLRENGGGETALLLDAFMQLFPDKEPFSAQRYRAQDQFKLVGEAVDAIQTNETALKWVEKNTELGIASGYSLRYWSYWNFIDANGKTFSSWDSFYGPHKFNDDEFSSIVRYNLSNSNPSSILPGNFTFTEASNNKKAPFSADNIVMFTDGLCGSSCASFHEELKNIAGIKAVTVGGRAKPGPMQTIGGTKGGEVIPFSAVSYDIPELLNVTTQLGIAPDLDSSPIHRILDTEQVFLRVGDSYSRLQVQDQIRKGDSSQTPLQYIYEAADCRIWYTAQTLVNPEKAWAAAWNAHTKRTNCVEGSTGHNSSLSGGYRAYGAGALDGKDGSGSDKDSSAESNAALAWRPSLGLVSGAVVLMSLVL